MDPIEQLWRFIEFCSSELRKQADLWKKLSGSTSTRSHNSWKFATIQSYRAPFTNLIWLDFQSNGKYRARKEKVPKTLEAKLKARIRRWTSKFDQNGPTPTPSHRATIEKENINTKTNRRVRTNRSEKEHQIKMDFAVQYKIYRTTIHRPKVCFEIETLRSAAYGYENTGKNVKC